MKGLLLFFATEAPGLSFVDSFQSMLQIILHTMQNEESCR